MVLLFVSFKCLTIILIFSTIFGNKDQWMTKSFEGNVPKQAIRKFNPGGQYFVLTIEGGPQPQTTPKLLEILRNCSVRATFFVSGARSLQHLSLLQDIAKEKHDIGVTGFHPGSQLHLKTRTEIETQFNASIALLPNVTRSRTKYFRPPNPLISDSLASFIAAHHPSIKTILWTIDLTYLIKELHMNAVALRRVMQERTKPGDIFRCVESKALLRLLPTILEGLRAAKYELVTLTDMFTFPDDTPK